MVCCMKTICFGCHGAAKKRGMDDCPFCRTPKPENHDDALAMIQAQVLKKDRVAIHQLGLHIYQGGLGLQKDMQRAVELYTEAAQLGSIEALFSIGSAYDLGKGAQQDKAKAAEFYRKAAMQGSVSARHNLGGYEGQKGNHGRAVRHYLISAKMGLKESVAIIKLLFMGGLATNEQHSEALRGYQNAVEEMKSHDRDEAKRLRDRQKHSRLGATNLLLVAVSCDKSSIIFQNSNTVLSEHLGSHQSL